MRDFTDLIPYHAGLPYGMTKQQMIRRLGKPERVAGQCLQYPENLVSWNGRRFTAVRMCFFGGQYQGWFLKIDGVWNTPGIYKAIEPPTTVTAVPLKKTIPDWSKALMNDALIQTEPRRRFRRTGSVAVLVAALATFVACQYSPNAGAAQHSSTQTVTQKNWFTYGMTKKQVIRIIGRPKTIRGNYWYYPVVHGLIANKVRIVVYGTNVLQPANQFRIFWYAGQLQGEQIHVKVPGRYIWRGVIL